MGVQNYKSDVQSCSHRPIQGPEHLQNLPSADYLGPRALGGRKGPLVKLPASILYWSIYGSPACPGHCLKGHTLASKLSVLSPHMAPREALGLSAKGILLHLSCLLTGSRKEYSLDCF